MSVKHLIQPSSTYFKVQTWLHFNRHALDNNGWVWRHTQDTMDEFNASDVNEATTSEATTPEATTPEATTPEAEAKTHEVEAKFMRLGIKKLQDL